MLMLPLVSVAETVVVVSMQSSAESLTASQAADIFLGKLSALPGGGQAVTLTFLVDNSDPTVKTAQGLVDAFTAKQQMAAIGGIRGGNRFCGKTERSKSRGDQIAEAVHARHICGEAVDGDHLPEELEGFRQMALPAGEQGRIFHAPGLKRFARSRQSRT